jgi:hypothetical protein
MSYFRPMGDPITDPRQDDDGHIIASVPPTRVPCDALPPDALARQPGQVCAPPPPIPFFDTLKNLVTAGFGPSTPTTAPATQDTGTDTTHLWLLAAAGGLAYYLYRSRKRRT